MTGLYGLQSLKYSPSGPFTTHALSRLEYNRNHNFQNPQRANAEFITVTLAAVIVYSKESILSLEITEPENTSVF